MKALRTLSVPLCGVLSLFPASPVFADTFGTGANEFTIDFVSIGNPGNVADSTGYGAVPYDYQVGKYEVSRDMITKVNNSGGLGITLADMTSFGGNGANRPATGVTWYEAAAFVNWLNTSTGHQAAYNLSGAGLSLWSSADAWQAGGENRFRHREAYYFLPNENEWYKAAYYSPGGVYYIYPTGNDNAPVKVAGGTEAGTAVYGQPLIQGPASIESAGGLSAYGTMGQAGNVWEWMEGAAEPPNSSGSEQRAARGGFWFSSFGDFRSFDRYGEHPWNEGDSIGFRVAAIPEPLETAGAFGALVLGFALCRRRK